MKYFLILLFISFSAMSQEISVLTWNTFLIPPPFNFTQQEERADLMATKLKAINHDVIFFQETFFEKKRSLIIKELSSMYPYVAIPKRGDGILQIQGSGLLIVSKYPMKVLDQVVFKDCSGTDCFAAKSAMIVEITLPSNEKVQMIGTHLQGWNGPEIMNIRKNQLLEIKEMMKAHAKTGIAQVLIGDLNIDGRIKPEYDNSLALMDMTSTPLEGKFNFSNGFSTVGCFDNPGGINPGEWIDHMWLKPNGTEIQINSKKVVPILGKIGPKECPLSDHYAVEAIIELNKNKKQDLAKKSHPKIYKNIAV